jgi:hypothetical protein
MQKRQNCRPQALRQDADECVVTGSRIVHACHIIPQYLGDEKYRHICGGSNRNEPANLVLLTPTLHAAFDSFMFSFAPTGRGTHAVEVYVSDPLLDPYAGRIVRLAAGDAQLAAHRAACESQGRSVGSQEREDDLDWDARTVFSTAHEDVRPAPLEGPNREPQGTTQRDTDSERNTKNWVEEWEEREVERLTEAVRAGINIREQPSRIHAAPAAPTHNPKFSPSVYWDWMSGMFWRQASINVRFRTNRRTGRLAVHCALSDDEPDEDHDHLTDLFIVQVWEDLCQRQEGEGYPTPPLYPDAAAAMARLAARQ